MTKRNFTMNDEARNALRRARTNWTTLRRQMAQPSALPVGIRAKFLANTVTDDGYLSSWIADKLERDY